MKKMRRKNPIMSPFTKYRPIVCIYYRMVLCISTSVWPFKVLNFTFCFCRLPTFLSNTLRWSLFGLKTLIWLIDLVWPRDLWLTVAFRLENEKPRTTIEVDLEDFQVRIWDSLFAYGVPICLHSRDQVNQQVRWQIPLSQTSI